MDEFYDLRNSVNHSVYQFMQTYCSDIMNQWNEECCKYNNMADEEVGECGENLTRFQVAVFGSGETIEEYLAEYLWGDFGDVPMNPETECIERDWNVFPSGTHREEIWHWFEEKLNVSVAALMYC